MNRKHCGHSRNHPRNWLPSAAVALVAALGVARWMVPTDILPVVASETEAKQPALAMTLFVPKPKEVFGETPAIAVVMDNLSLDQRLTRAAIALPKGVMLSFLPSPQLTPTLSREAFEAGHQVLVHLPMGPEGAANPGVNALTLDLPEKEIRLLTQWALSRVSYYDGFNNHMGSRFTTSAKALSPVMEELAVRHLFFLDSRTTAKTVAVQTARKAGLLSGARDIFLDDDLSEASIEAHLSAAERLARSAGSAVVIGHPHA